MPPAAGPLPAAGGAATVMAVTPSDEDDALVETVVTADSVRAPSLLPVPPSSDVTTMSGSGGVRCKIFGGFTSKLIDRLVLETVVVLRTLV